MRSCLILQPFGLGDCIFAQGVARYFIANNYKVYWPVVNQYLQDLRRAYPGIHWVSENFLGCNAQEIADIKTATAVPIRWSDTIMNVPYNQVMRAKYDMYKLDWTKWKESAMWQRFPVSELQPPMDDYNLISETYTSDFRTSRSISVNNNLTNYYIKPMHGYSLFDWAKVIEHATELHMVASSNIYLLEMLTLRAKEVHIYLRGTERDHRNYDYILRSHRYIFH